MYTAASLCSQAQFVYKIVASIRIYKMVFGQGLSELSWRRAAPWISQKKRISIAARPTCRPDFRRLEGDQRVHRGSMLIAHIQARLTAKFAADAGRFPRR